VSDRTYTWRDDAGEHELRFVRVAGTNGSPYKFGAADRGIPIDIRDFYIATTQTTQALWQHVMGENPAKHPGPNHPIENVSWEHITGSGGFLERINASPVLDAFRGNATLRFRLPSETEWEYAARGGPHWRDGFAFSGSNNPDEVAWYGPRWTPPLQLAARVFGWRFAWFRIANLPFIKGMRGPTRTHDVALKKPNQLGVYDMSGNVWEWCEDVCTDDPALIARDGSPYLGPGEERRLRGGCHTNWDLHCTVSWRYGIIPDAHDSCLGFRLVLA
jgi:formylglycine-generating enzyme required for sulfatase activity